VYKRRVPLLAATTTISASQKDIRRVSMLCRKVLCRKVLCRKVLCRKVLCRKDALPETQRLVLAWL
jgi:hypothetical protein